MITKTGPWSVWKSNVCDCQEAGTIGTMHGPVIKLCQGKPGVPELGKQISIQNTVDFKSYTTQERDELTLPFSILPALAKLFDFLLIVKQR